MTVAYAAKVYLAVATRTNKLDDVLKAKQPKTWTLTQARVYYAKLAGYSRDFADRLKARIWPPEAAADMKLLLRATAREGLYELTLSKAKTWAEFDRVAATLEKISLDRSGLANAVRTDLGLAPVPID